MFVLDDRDVHALVLSVLLIHVDRQPCPRLTQLWASGKQARVLRVHGPTQPESRAWQSQRPAEDLGHHTSITFLSALCGAGLLPHL